MKVNIYDVAERAGVSITTVSRVMNKNGRVSQKTIDRVNKIIEEMGYHPNMFAKGLANRRTNIIGVLLPSFGDVTFTDTFSMEFLCGIQEVLKKHDYNILIINHQANHEKLEVAEYKKLIDGDKIDGLIAFEGMISCDYLMKCEKRKFPILLIGDNDNQAYSNHTRLFERELYHKGLSYLKAQAHKDICIIHYVYDDNEPARIRFYQKLFDALELPFDPKVNLLNGNCGNAKLSERIRVHMESGKVTAYFTDSVDYASMVINSTRILEKKIPQELSLITMQHAIDETDVLYPKTNYVFLSGYDVGKDASGKLFKMLSLDVKNEERPEYELMDCGSVRNLEQK